MMTDNTTEATIVRVIEVEDTREVIEIEDRFVRVPGSGNPNQCRRCGRDHEVWYTVLLSDNTQAVVGKSCAKADTLDGDRKLKSDISRLESIAKVRSKIARLEAKIAAFEAAEEEVEKLPLPRVVQELTEVKESYGRKVSVYTYTCGDAEVRGYVDAGESPNSYERLHTAQSFWKGKRLEERGFKRYEGSTFYNELTIAGRRLRKLLKAEAERDQL
jgi:hypothetical protein